MHRNAISYLMKSKSQDFFRNNFYSGNVAKQYKNIYDILKIESQLNTRSISHTISKPKFYFKKINSGNHDPSANLNNLNIAAHTTN